MPQAPSIDVGPVIPVDDGYGFSIMNEDRAPVVTFAYPTQKDAEEARDLIDRAITKADSVVTVAPRRAEN